MGEGLLSRFRRWADRISASRDMRGDGGGTGPSVMPVPEEWREPPPPEPFEPAPHEVTVAPPPRSPTVEAFPHPEGKEGGD